MFYPHKGSSETRWHHGECTSKSLGKAIRGIEHELERVEHTGHEKGIEHQFRFEIQHPANADTSKILHRVRSPNTPSAWIKGISGLTEAKLTLTEGEIRCFYGE